MIQLSRGDDSLIVEPEHGGAIMGWTRGGVHQLRRPSPEAVLLGQPGFMGLFPLVPYCNRIAWRHFTWAGETYELAANFGDHPHAIHGVGWQRPWQMERVATDTLTLSLRHDARGENARAWPFDFAARLTYRLTDNGLTIELEATNLHSAPVPMGIGVHPYFPREPGASIAFQANGVWLTRDDLPVSHVPIPPEWDHAAGRKADGEPLDNCFTGWRGPAYLPLKRIEAAAAFGNLQVFTPTGATFMCVEPMSHVPDAINRPDLPGDQAMQVLSTGQTLSGWVRFAAAGEQPH